MFTPEAEFNPSRQYQDLRATREWLGKPIFRNEKQGHKMAKRFVANTINYIFRSKELVQVSIQKVAENCRKQGSSITTASVASESCLGMSRYIQRRLLIMLSDYKKENRPIEIAALDVLKGFQQVLSADLAYDSSAFIESYEDPKLIIAGAKLALKTYRKMYPIAQKVLSSGN